jgi:sporulation protein YlmC with PRC-barrel domain
MTDVEAWRGRTVVDEDGDKIGTLEDVYYDEQTNAPEWGLVHTGMLGTRQSIIPLVTVSFRGEDIAVPYDKKRVKGAPNVDADEDLSQSEEATLAEYYGLSYSEARSDSGLPEAGAAAARTQPRSADDAMAGSEEQLRVGKVRRPHELARLKNRM